MSFYNAVAESKLMIFFTRYVLFPSMLPKNTILNKWLMQNLLPCLLAACCFKDTRKRKLIGSEKNLSDSAPDFALKKYRISLLSIPVAFELAQLISICQIAKLKISREAMILCLSNNEIANTQFHSVLKYQSITALNHLFFQLLRSLQASPGGTSERIQ